MLLAFTTTWGQKVLRACPCVSHETACTEFQGICADVEMQFQGTSLCTCGAPEKVGELEEKIKDLESRLEIAENNCSKPLFFVKYFSNFEFALTSQLLHLLHV